MKTYWLLAFQNESKSKLPKSSEVNNGHKLHPTSEVDQTTDLSHPNLPPPDDSIDNVEEIMFLRVSMWTFNSNDVSNNKYNKKCLIQSDLISSTLNAQMVFPKILSNNDKQILFKMTTHIDISIIKILYIFHRHIRSFKESSDVGVHINIHIQDCENTKRIFWVFEKVCNAHFLKLANLKLIMLRRLATLPSYIFASIP